MALAAATVGKAKETKVYPGEPAAAAATVECGEEKERAHVE